MNCKKWESLKREIITVLKEGDVPIFAAIKILDEVKREIESEALGKKL